MSEKEKSTNSKFERLISILKGNKYTFAMKRAAAEQIGFLQKEFAYELSYLLEKLYPLIMHPNYDTRCGAALAIGFLIPQCNHKYSRWSVTRNYGKFEEFNAQMILNDKDCPVLLNTWSSETELPSDYKNQQFKAEDNNISELCQFTELLLTKLDSNDWFYRHGAVIALGEVYKGLKERNELISLPKFYLEDIAVRLLILICRDRFIDASVSDKVIIPVSMEACKLISKIIITKPQQLIPIIEQLIQAEPYQLRLCAWLILKNCSAIDAKVFDINWIYNHFKNAFQSSHDDDIFQDVITYAAEAVYPIVGKIEEKDEVAKLVWDEFMNYDPINSFNQILLDITLKLLEKQDVTYFATKEGLDTIYKCIIAGTPSTGSLEARKSAYALLTATMKVGYLDVWSDYDIAGLSETLIRINLNEDKYNLMAVSLFDCLKSLLDIQGFEFGEDYVVRICSNIASDKKNLDKLGSIISILISIGKYINLNVKENLTFKGVENPIAICFIYIICLSMLAKEPTLAKISPMILKVNPIPIFKNLFTFKPRKTLDYIPEITTVKLGAFRKFITDYVALSIKNYKHEERKIIIIEQLISEESTNHEECFFPKLIPESNPNRSFAVAISQVRRDITSDVLNNILLQCTTILPKVISSRETLLRCYYYVMGNNILPRESLEQLIKCFAEDNEEYLVTMAAWVAEIYARRKTEEFMQVYLTMDLPKFNRGQAEFIDLFMSNIQFGKHQWCSFFIPSLLENRFKTDDKVVQQYISHSLANSIKYLPLEKSDELNVPENLKELKLQSLEKLKPLFDPKLIKPMEILPEPSVSPLDYQFDGIKWLGFLLEFGLNGILADDMGLGKTFQTLCAISTVHKHAIEKGENPISLIFAPPNVVYHWTKEVEKFFPWMETVKINNRSFFKNNNLKKFSGLVVTSYGMSKHFVNLNIGRPFKYIVLDEGHLIKNSSSSTAQNITSISSEHRLILSGTPIQNGALDLWSLFNFLMPGYLGPLEQFRKLYENPINKMFDTNASEQDTERGRKALEDLHSQVLPLILRRLKTDVLNSVLPKSYNTETATLSEVQKNLLQSHFEQIDEEEITEATFTKLKFERNVNIHPELESPDSCEGTIEESGKLVVLRDLLLYTLGFGPGKEEVLRQKVVIFCESESAIKEIIKYVIPCLVDTTFVKFDSSLSQDERDKNIDAFMSENGPDLFIATKSAAGHGINLTAANVVVFFELNWNPAIDLQAEDRVHRIGQKKQVRIYSIVMEGTIDERIENSQKRKKMIMDSVIHDQKELGDLDTTGLNQNITGEMTEAPEKPMSFKELINSDIKYDKDAYNQMDN
ncbi:SNF2 family N-terminal domain containing protein [Trichomonas vaginalis G3]|uniref:SNF2 family N-terminal domain containing protein n=1 Tax=Trichomonas vaginalis (strain ATCC PRA-98 / G3) TaxID=412133 RepID=A2EY36_TRIV3|nr:B-TFIID TATA-box-binding protein-associated factor 1 family [Trichomonas vaginalis G3]EAY02446.1 SNF2 family N-terminal domain containing protein [Trichomonas vaginalis G3]KAI5527859.1 B-TFIID TATA-box-binding protein-associated factor 1 family [Trichomonas vaginalis G3]|eukprot:XP_001330686.1 SNF2 family N-terminal domain containing protein [Trichomonas vaginalis G3]